MKPDPLLIASGLVGSVEVSPEAIEALRDIAHDFLLSGGTLTLAEYGQLSPDSRVALRAAGARLDADRAAVLAERLIALLDDEVAAAGSTGAREAAGALADAVIGGM